MFQHVIRFIIVNDPECNARSTSILLVNINFSSAVCRTSQLHAMKFFMSL